MKIGRFAGSSGQLAGGGDDADLHLGEGGEVVVELRLERQAAFLVQRQPADRRHDLGHRRELEDRVERHRLAGGLVQEADTPCSGRACRRARWRPPRRARGPAAISRSKKRSMRASAVVREAGRLGRRGRQRRRVGGVPGHRGDRRGRRRRPAKPAEGIGERAWSASGRGGPRRCYGKAATRSAGNHGLPSDAAPAVDLQRDAGDHRRLVAAQEARGVAHVFGRREAAERDRREELARASPACPRP